jgi:hypothetical protein
MAPALFAQTAHFSGAVTILGPGLNGLAVQGVAVDANGNVFVGDSANGAVKGIELAPSFPATAVASSGSPLSFYFTFDTGGTIAAPLVLTQGGTNLDFTDAGTGSCTTNGASNSYNPGDVCAVDLTFKPTHSGTRLGGAELTTSAGTLVASAYVSGTGSGPQVVFSNNNIQNVLGSGFFKPAGVAAARPSPRRPIPSLRR